MVISELKTKSMLVRTIQTLTKLENKYLNLKKNYYKIEHVTSYKLLGVILDENLKWEEQINYVCKSLISKLNLLGNIKGT